jgi:hypothetical protein
LAKGTIILVARRREITQLTIEEKQEKRKAILAALAKASEDSKLFVSTPGPASRNPQDYYTLSRDEIDALVNGDMAKIEAWVSNLDKNHASRLLQWLAKEKW